METHSREGVMKEEKSPNTRKHSHQWVSGEFWNIRGQQNWGKKQNKKDLHTMHLTTTPSGEVAQTLASASSEQGLNRESCAACLE